MQKNEQLKEYLFHAEAILRLADVAKENNIYSMVMDDILILFKQLCFYIFLDGENAKFEFLKIMDSSDTKLRNKIKKLLKEIKEC